jgi:UDP-galactopyranose mutase
MPRNGYTAIVERILSHSLIDVRLSTSVTPSDLAGFRHIVWTGPIDQFFDHKLGRLPYRTLDFKREHHVGDFQGCPVMNYPDRDVPFTRITEHKHFAPWEEHEGSTIFYEYSRECSSDDIPFYPVHLSTESEVIAGYEELAGSTPNVTFLGRLGTFRYIDMDVTIALALEAGDRLADQLKRL